MHKHNICNRLFRACTLMFGSFAFALLAEIIPLQAQETSVYSPSGWATLHQSGANRRSQPIDLSSHYRTWRALEGASTLTVPVVGPEGNLYVSAGLPRGCSNLYAFTLNCQPLWQAQPWQDKKGVDACAILSSPIVDRDGDIYISDCNQLWAFKPDGRVKWVIDLPEPPEDAPLQQPDFSVNAFTTAIFTRDGDVLGVTNFGQVVLVDRATGAAHADIFQLPGLIPPPSTKYPLRDSILGHGLMDASLREWAWQLIFGGNMRSANTPAVDAATGRVFVAATSETPGRGAMYGLDIRPAQGGRYNIEIAFSSDMGPGTGSSPSLSPNGDRAYVSDDEGMFYAFNTRTGAKVWQLQTKAAAGAASVAPDGTIYALQEKKEMVIAISPDGRRLWESNIDELIQHALPSRWYLGGPIAISTGNPVAVNGAVLVPLLYCYSIGFGRWQVPIPVKSVLTAIDAYTGKGIRDVVTLADDSSGITAVLPDGTILNSFGAVVTSATLPVTKISRWLLPAGLSQLQPTGGFQVSRPANNWN